MPLTRYCAALCAALVLAACGRSDPAPPVDRGSAGTPSPAKQAPPPRPEIPTLRVETFDGGVFDLSRHRGHWVVVNFWATWCNPCLKEIPDLDAFDRSRVDVEAIGLAFEEIERADMEAFLKTHPISYPIALLDVYAPPADFDPPRGLPMTYLIAPDGKVARKFLGPVTSDELAKAISDATVSG